MTSSDVRDVLNLPDGSHGPRPAKKQKLAAPRPNLKGLAREVQNLGGDNPIAIVPEVTQFKKRRLISRKPAARWELRAFRNSGRDDPTLILRHWRRKEAAAAEEAPAADAQEETKPKQEETEDSAFAKFNVRVSVPQYSDDQYQSSLQNSDWTKEETDYLMETVRDFDLRWPLIWDRYEWNPPATNGHADPDGDESKAIVPVSRSRSMEELKARYYEVASKMMAAQKPVQYMTQPEFQLHEQMAHFNPQQEKKRKEFAITSFSRSPEEAREEESLLLEVKRIIARNERFNEERKELYNRLDYPHAETDISTFKSSTGLQTLLQNLMNVDKSKKRKSLMGTDGVSPSGPAAPQNAAQEPARRESNAAAQREPPSATSTTTPTAAGKKGQQQPVERRKLTDQEEALYGVTHHDRLGSGPTFRTEKINKLFSHKSHQQQLRITNTLNELDVPNKLAMATAATTHQFEMLLGAVNSLLDARKVTDKIDAEIKIEQAKKAEREKDLAPGEAEPEKAEEPGSEGEKKEDATASAETAKPDEKQTDATAGAGEKLGEKAGDKPATADEDQQDLEPPADEAAESAVEEKNERPGSSGASHKRSASVLSAVSDKSAKRQKK
ncbi:SWR1-complex protein 4 [Stachybotrys elegans]|uniref:SWR1-complex protein 4 n=1 Tax=Stachybotrys elegans TaxID=80388 RepID=A0A8K0WW24_9HYPO|nr:SWR1-complex protein 4 [Stachybotrys elegans]